MIFCLLRQSTALRSSFVSYSLRQTRSSSCSQRGRFPRQFIPFHFFMTDDASSTPPDRSAPNGAPGSLERLCSVSLQACELMKPLISSIYQQLVSSNLGSENRSGGCGCDGVQKLKEDSSAFTIADGLVQRLLTDILYSRISFRDIVGEEEEEEEEEVDDEYRDDNSWVEKGGTTIGDESWFQVQGLSIPHELRPLVISTKAAIDALAEASFSSLSQNNTSNHSKIVDYQNLTVFIDPIDGTREFSTGMGEQCSICIGFADERGKAVAGLIYRPLSQPKPTWVAGSKSERFSACDFGGDKVIQSLDGKMTSFLDMAINENKKRGSLLTTNGSISPFLESLIEELQMERVKSGGAGNKLMMLLEHSLFGNHADGRSVLYIQDRGVSRWDTCGAEAVLEAFGGKLMKLTTYLPETMHGEERQQSNFKGESYTYLASPTNLDFIPSVATITKYNCSPSTKDAQGNQKALDVNDVKPYSNLCGLVAFGNEWNTHEGSMHIEMAIRRAARIHPPSFD